ncbi:MAG TPA: hypothetical protein VF018_03450 [Acidobacteriaceae bacterium]
MFKAAVATSMLMMIAAPAHAQQTRMQIPCPVMLVSGDAGRDSIRLSFRNKGKMPIQELSFACSPPIEGQARGSICHMERGLFYPGQKYSFDFGYAGARRHSVSISVKTARLGDGSVWISRPSAACKPLRVMRKP